MRMIINEDRLKLIIENAALEVIQENLKGQMAFGVKGNIPLQPAVKLCDDVNPQVLAKCDDGSRSIPRGQLGDPQYFGGTKIWDAYKQYSAAISRRADIGRTPVSFFIFLNKVRHGWKGSPLEVYEKDGNYLLGITKMGYFLCVYLCPKTVGIGMFKFIKEVCEYDNVIFAVTDDMAKMLEKLGCPKHDGAVTAKFRGQVSNKIVYGSTQEAAEAGAKLLGLMGKTGDIGKIATDAMQQNPQLMQLYQDNPQIVYQLMNQPIITKLLADNPKMVDELINNPDMLKSFSANPKQAILDMLKSKSNKLATSVVNEMKKRKKRI